MQKDEAMLDGLYDNWAKRLQGIGEFANRFGTVEGVRELVNALIADDPKVFPELVNEFDLPVFDKSIWVRDVVEVVTSNFLGFEMECWLVKDMTASQRSAYIRILIEFGYYPSSPDGLVTLEDALAVPIYESQEPGRWAVKKGDFQKALEAAGLIDGCNNVVRKYAVGTDVILSPPHRIDF